MSIFLCVCVCVCVLYQAFLLYEIEKAAWEVAPLASWEKSFAVFLARK